MAYKFPYLVTSTQTIASVLATNNGFGSATNIAWTVNNGFRQLIAPIAMDFHDMYMQLGVAPGAGTSRTAQSRKNLSTDNLTLTISDAATLGSDTTHTTSLAAQDLIDIYTTWTGSPADSTASNQWSVYANSANQVLFATDGNTVSATRYIGVQATSAQSTTETDVAQAFPTTGKLRNLTAYLGTGTLISGSYVVTLYQNGSPTSLTVTLDSSNRVAVDSTHEITIAEGDLLSWEQARNSPSTNRSILIACEFVPDTPGEGVLLTTAGPTVVSHSTKQYSGFYSCSNLFSTSATGRQAYALPMTIKKIYGQLGTAPGIGSNRVLAVDVGGSDVLSVTISDTNTSGSNTGSATINLGDSITISSLKNGGANSTIKVGVVFQAESISSSNSGFFNFM